MAHDLTRSEVDAVTSEATQRYRAARDQLLDLREDYERAIVEFRWPEVGETFNWAFDWFDTYARGNHNVGLIVVSEDGARRERTFAELTDRSDQVAMWLGDLGVSKGDSVLVMLTNQPELWEVMLALMKLGAVIVPTTTALNADDLAARIDRCSARGVICNPEDADKFAGMPDSFLRISVGEVPGWRDVTEAFTLILQAPTHPGSKRDDPLLRYFTSGTTSKPKLVQHTQVSYPVGHLSTMYWLGLKPGDVHLNISSPGWAKHAWSCFFAPWIAEATVLVFDYARFDPKALLESLRRERITTFCAPPTVWRMLINADLGERPEGLRELISAGEPLSPEVISRIEKAWGLTVRDGFGQTEMTAAIGNSPGPLVKFGSMGRPMPGVPVVLVDPITGKRANQEGEICLDLSASPLSLMTGYEGDPDRNAEAMAGGYYRTGDVATIDADGYITFIGRTDDVFKASDYKVSPFEVESILIEHPAVAEAAVVPAPDEIRLAVTKAYLVLRPGFEPSREMAADIFAFSRQRMAPHMRVRRLEFFDLPKTISGKIRRVELREREEALAGSGPTEGEYRIEDFPEIRS